MAKLLDPRKGIWPQTAGLPVGGLCPAAASRHRTGIGSERSEGVVAANLAP